MTSVSQPHMGKAFIMFTHLLHKLKKGVSLVARAKNQDPVSVFIKGEKKIKYILYIICVVVFNCFIRSFLKLRWRSLCMFASLCMCCPGISLSYAVAYSKIKLRLKW